MSRGGYDASDSARLNQEDLFNNIRKTTEDIQHLTLLGGQLDFNVRYIIYGWQLFTDITLTPIDTVSYPQK